MKTKSWFVIIFAFVPSLLFAQANDSDVKTPDSLIAALYDVISGPAGPRDWDRFRNLFTEGASINMVVMTPDGEKFRSGTIEDYISGASELFAKSDFHEKELGRKTHEMGNLIQVFSAFEFVHGKSKPQTGVNGLQLIRANDRWYVAHLTYNLQKRSEIDKYFE